MFPSMQSVLRFNILPLVVGERDALRRHLEVDDGGGGWRSGGQRLGYCFGNGLGARQRFHLHRVDVENIACWEERNSPKWMKSKGNPSRFMQKLYFWLVDMLPGTKRGIHPNHSTCIRFVTDENIDVKRHVPYTDKHVWCTFHMWGWFTMGISRGALRCDNKDVSLSGYINEVIFIYWLTSWCWWS